MLASIGQDCKMQIRWNAVGLYSDNEEAHINIGDRCEMDQIKIKTKQMSLTLTVRDSAAPLLPGTCL